MSREKQIKSTDWLTRGVPKEQLEREKQEAIMSADLALCHTEFMSGVGEIYTDYDTTAQKMYNAGYRKQEWISVDERLPEENGRYLVCVAIRHLVFEDLTMVVIMGYNKINGFDVVSGEETVTHWMPLPSAPKMKGDKQ